MLQKHSKPSLIQWWRLLATILVTLGASILMWQSALAIQVPSAASEAFIQTSGPNTPIGVGDWYATAGPGFHEYVLNVPCSYDGDTPITISLFDPEVWPETDSIAVTRDEVRDAGNTEISFTGTPAQIALAGPATFTLKLASGLVLTQSFVPTSSLNQTWVEYVTFTPNTPGFECGKHIFQVRTFDNNDNAWRIQMTHDPDCVAATYPQVGVCSTTNISNANRFDDADNIPFSGDELTIGFDQTAYQHPAVPGGGFNQPPVTCQAFFFYVDGSQDLMARTFDIDGAPTPPVTRTITLTPPVGSTFAPSQSLPLSTNANWASRTFSITAADIGWWETEVCLDGDNQYIFDANAKPLFFEIPPTTMSIDKDDGEVMVTPTQILTYNIVFHNDSLVGPAVNLVLTDTLPPELDYISCSILAPLTGNCFQVSMDTVVYTITEEIPSGMSGTVQLVAQVVSGTMPGSFITNSVELYYEDQLRNPYVPVRDDDVDQTEDPSAVTVSQITAVPALTHLAWVLVAMGLLALASSYYLKDQEMLAQLILRYKPKRHKGPRRES